MGRRLRPQAAVNSQTAPLTPTTSLGASASWRWWMFAIVSMTASAALFWVPFRGYRFDLSIYINATQSGIVGLYDYAEPIYGLGFTYPPFAAFIFEPAHLLNPMVADRVWFVLSFVLTIGFLLGCVALMPAALRRASTVPLALGIGVWLIPMTSTFRLGQINALIASLVLLDVYLMRRGSKWAGVGTGVATAIKLTPGLLIVGCWFAFRRREAVVMALSAAACTLVAGIVAFNASWRYWTVMLFDSERVGEVSDQFSNALRRPFAWLPTNDRIDTVLWLMTCVALIGWILRRMRANVMRDDPLRFVTVMMLLSALVAPITWTHHLYFLAPALLLVLHDIARLRHRWWVGFAILMLAIDPLQRGDGPQSTALRIGLLLWLVWVLTRPRSAPIDLPTDTGTATNSGEGYTPSPSYSS